ncbi:MAG: MarR family transcriptional regulator [Desulfobacterales bacterium]|nr:MarR family transcriptional regulator [Desulfobacterales bacterium]
MGPDITEHGFSRFDQLFHKIINKMKRIEQKPRHFGTEVLLYPSEIHTIDAIGCNAGINMTELAALQGVTKGAVSQIVRKLVDKDMVVRMKDERSDREVLLMLTGTGKVAFEAHKDFHGRVDPGLARLIQGADESQIAFVEELFITIDRFCDQLLARDGKSK